MAYHFSDKGKRFASAFNLEDNQLMLEGEINQPYWLKAIEMLGVKAMAYEFVVREYGNCETFLNMFKLTSWLSDPEFINHIDAYSVDKMKQKPYVIWMYGTAGSGKSVSANEQGTVNETYIKGVTDKWWDGYQTKHKIVVLDDLGWNDVNLDNAPFSDSVLKRLLDRWPVRVERKGSSIVFNPEKIIITSALSPEEIFMDQNDSNRWAQMERRIDEIWYFEGKHHGYTPSLPKKIMVKNGKKIKVNERTWIEKNVDYESPVEKSIVPWVSRNCKKLERGGDSGESHDLLIMPHESSTYRSLCGRFKLFDDSKYHEFLDSYCHEVINKRSLIPMLEQPYGWRANEENGVGLYLDIDCVVLPHDSSRYKFAYNHYIQFIVRDIITVWNDFYPDHMCNMRLIVAVHEDFKDSCKTGDRSMHIYQCTDEKELMDKKTVIAFAHRLNRPESEFLTALKDDLKPTKGEGDKEKPVSVFQVYDAQASGHNIAMLYGGKKQGRRYLPYMMITIKDDNYKMDEIEDMGEKSYDQARELIEITSRRAMGYKPALPRVTASINNDGIIYFERGKTTLFTQMKRGKEKGVDLMEKQAAMQYYKENKHLSVQDRKEFMYKMWPKGMGMMDAAEKWKYKKKFYTTNEEMKKRIEYEETEYSKQLKKETDAWLDELERDEKRQFGRPRRGGNDERIDS